MDLKNGSLQGGDKYLKEGWSPGISSFFLVISGGGKKRGGGGGGVFSLNNLPYNGFQHFEIKDYLRSHY